MHVRHDSAQIAQWRWCAACRSHSSAQVVQARTHDSSKGCTTSWSHWPARERTRAVTSQMSAHVWQSAMQTRIARTSSSMRSESAQAMQVCTQFKEASIAAATSTRSSGACWGEASSIWRVSVMLVLVFVVAVLSWLGRSLRMVALIPPARRGLRRATRRTFRKMIEMRVPPRCVYPRYPRRLGPRTRGRCELGEARSPSPSRLARAVAAARANALAPDRSQGAAAAAPHDLPGDDSVATLRRCPLPVSA